MSQQNGWARSQDAIPRDGFGIPIQDSDVPKDHPLLLREEIKRNAGGDVVAVLLVYKTSQLDPTEIVYRKDITPISGDTAAVTTQTIYPWVKV